MANRFVARIWFPGCARGWSRQLAQDVDRQAGRFLPHFWVALAAWRRPGHQQEHLCRVRSRARSARLLILCALTIRSSRDRFVASAPTGSPRAVRLNSGVRGHMKISDDSIEAAILSSGKEFDSHEIIRRIAQQNQHAYISELSSVDSDTPFQTFHSMLGKRIKVICERHGFTGEASRSQDIFGQFSNCVFWSRQVGL